MLDILKRNKRKLLNFKANKNERETIQAKANLFTGGNISAWIRYASLNHSPAAQELSKSHDADAKE